jgi:hypothetical protein
VTRHFLRVVAAVLSILLGFVGQGLAQTSGESQSVSWDCTGANCPWGSPLVGQALVWPAPLAAVSNRLGYSTSAGVYLPAASANGLTIAVSSGNAAAYAGLPDAASHRFLGTIGPGQPFYVTGLSAGEVISVQGDGTFAFTLTPPDPEDPPPPGQPEGTSSTFSTWTCTTSPCPWGPMVGAHALVWPAAMEPLNGRLGYSVSTAVYLSEGHAEGMTISLVSGSASVYAGLPGATSHRLLGNVSPGQPYQVPYLATGEVISVQAQDSFTFVATPGDPPGEEDPEDPEDPPVPGSIHSVPAFWRCNLPGCESPDWIGSVINWPAWAAYESNNRAGTNSRTVYSDAGEVLYPYMGAWAHGCQVTAVSGVVVIIEWQRGAEVWRATRLEPGESHTISLVSPENNAMIETEDFSLDAFSVLLNNCNPQPK